MHEAASQKSEAKSQKPKLLRILLLLIITFACDLGLGVPMRWLGPYNLYAQDKIVAIVNKDIITQRDLDDFITFLRMQLSTEYSGRELEEKTESMKSDLLVKLIEDRLILQEAKKENIKIDPSRIKARVEEIKKHYGSDIEFQKDLGKRGLVLADIEAKIREQVLMYTIIDIKIRNKIIINPSEVTRFYEQNIEEFKLPEQREFESMMIDNQNLADEVFDKLKSGQDPHDIANSYSLSLNKINGAKDGRLRRDIEEIIFKMDIGQISPPVRIENNYYIFKLNNIFPPRRQTLSEVQDGISAALFNKKMEESLAQWMDELKARSYIKIM